MSISSIKSEILLPQKEFIIGRSFEIKGEKAFIVSITEQDGKIKLWVFMQFHNSHGAVSPALGYATQRDEITKLSQRVTGPSHFSKITIQDITLPVSGSTVGVIENNHMNYMKLQHFIEARVDLSPIEEISFEELALGEFCIQENHPFPEIDGEKALSISLCIPEGFQQVMITPSLRFTLDIGEHPADKIYSFYDPEEKRDIEFYIDSVICRDIYEDTEQRFKDEAILKIWRENGLDNAAIAQMQEHNLEALEPICPRGHDLLIIQYETPMDIQLSFYTTEFLESKPKHSNSSSSMLLLSGNEDSIHGHRVRNCTLASIPKDFRGPVEVELISWYRRIPEEQIKI